MAAPKSCWDGRLVQKTWATSYGDALPAGYCWRVYRYDSVKVHKSVATKLSERRIKMAMQHGRIAREVTGSQYMRAASIDERARWLADYVAWLGWDAGKVVSSYAALAKRIVADKQFRGRLPQWCARRTNGPTIADIVGYGCRRWDWRSRRWTQLHVRWIEKICEAREAGWPLRDGLSLEQIAAMAGAARQTEIAVRHLHAKTYDKPKVAPIAGSMGLPVNAPKLYLVLQNKPMLRIDVEW